MSDILFLPASDVEALLSWPPVIDAVKNALITRATAPAGSAAVQIAIPSGSLHLKAGALAQPPVLSIKANIRPDAGRANGALLLFDTEAFAISAIMHSPYLTAMRTAGTAAVAIRALLPLSGKPRGAALKVAVLGSGPVARAVVEALPLVMTVGDLALWSRDQANAERLASSLDGPAQIASSPAEAVAHADVIVTCTPSQQPLLYEGDVPAGALLVALGADSPGKRELGPGVLREAILFVDIETDASTVGETGHALREGETPKIIELGDFLAGNTEQEPQPGRLIVFDSVGSAIVDAAVASLVVEQAHARGQGRRISLAG